MDMDQAAVFLAGSILTMLGFIIIIIGIIIINNIIHKHWKPIKFFTHDSFNINPPPRFASQEEIDRLAPSLNKNDAKKS